MELVFWKVQDCCGNFTPFRLRFFSFCFARHEAESFRFASLKLTSCCRFCCCYCLDRLTYSFDCLKLMMRPNFSASREAPPTRHPSISGMDMSSSTLSGVTDPPYWMRVAWATSSSYISAKTVRKKACVSSDGVGGFVCLGFVEK